jgi:hypothetical protein
MEKRAVGRPYHRRVENIKICKHKISLHHKKNIVHHNYDDGTH